MESAPSKMRRAILFLAILASVLLAWRYWAFVREHPGLIAVLAGVLGEVACDWKDMKGESWKKFWGVLLIVGLGWELIEASAVDEELSESKKRAATNELTVASLSNETARLVFTNLMLRSNVVALELQIKETSKTVTQNAPLNLPIKSMAAQAMVVICATNFIGEASDQETALFGGHIELFNKNGERIAMLGCVQFDDAQWVIENGGPKSSVVSMRFNWPSSDKPFAGLDKFSEKNFSTSTLDKELASARLRVPKLGAHFKICRGSIILTINGTIERRFDAPAYTDELFPISTNRP